MLCEQISLKLFLVYSKILLYYEIFYMHDIVISYIIMFLFKIVFAASDSITKIPDIG